jgi:hypothetical protein
MIKKKIMTAFILFSFFTNAVTALEKDDMIELTGAINGRANSDLRIKTANIKKVLPKGTIGQIVKKINLRRGNSGFKIKVINAQNKVNFYWVFYNKKTPMMKLSTIKNPIEKDFEKSETSFNITAKEAKSAQLTKAQESVVDNTPEEALPTEEIESEMSPGVVTSKLAPNLPIQDENIFPPDIEKIKLDINRSVSSPTENYCVNCTEEIKQKENKTCRESNMPTESEMTNFIDSKKNNNEEVSKSTSVNGVEFQGESPVLIEAFRHLTTALTPLGTSANLANQKDIQQNYTINPTCNKVECAVEKIWGNDMGKKILYINLKHNFNASELAFDKSARFKKDELNDVLLSLEDLPSQYTPLGKPNQRLTHYTYNELPPGHTKRDISNNYIMLLDSWSKLSRSNRKETVFHELAHNISFKLNIAYLNPNWLQLSKWTSNNDYWVHGSNTCFMSKYAATHPAEDWAETLSAYRYQSKLLKDKCPSKYNYLKEVVFNNIEYNLVEACR